MILVSGLFFATAGLIVYQVVFPSVFATSPQPPFTESQESEAISSLITTANLTIDEAIQAVQDNNSTETLRLLSELRSDIADINGNVTNLIFSVAAQPP
ncbi:MAG TPA: hypothetical protein VFS97_14415 [Nitrososphaeraceae archaeon]|nr:hypothetical protein [Nitrososphaeraceae archaeon]